MMKPYNTRLFASAAVAAALALSSPPLLAQVAPAPTTVDPAPVLVIPDSTITQPAQPTIVLPTELPQTPPAPSTVTAPERIVSTRTERAAAPAAPEPRTPVAAPAEPVATAEAEQVAAEPALGTAADPATEAAVEPVAPIAAPEATATETPTNSDNALLYALAALAVLAAIALAIWGFIAIGRRKPVDRKAKATVERPIVAPAAPQPEPVAQAAVATPPAVAPSVSPIRPATPAPSLSHTGASVALPRTIPETYEERSALIKRMVEARPDRANPFTSPVQRYHRAKLILQSLGRDFGDAEPWIDLSQYPQNWPELANRKTAAA